MKILALLLSLAGSWIVEPGWIGPVCAEVVPDSTLPQPSQVTPSSNGVVITAGTRRGRNLFHSFRKFSVASGESASFQNIDSDVSNIFARVTGRTSSRIDGMIEVLQSDHRISPANLFLLNPNGILFGRNASLRIGGSFIATTADSINFADGTQFSAIRPQTSPLLSVSVPRGLQFGHHPGQIVNRSTAPLLDDFGNPKQDAQGNPLAGLVGSPDQTFALVGGNVTLSGGSSIRTEGGRIEIGSVSGAGQAILTPGSQGWELDYTGIKNFGDISLTNESQIDASSAAGGPIRIQGAQFILKGNSFAFTESADSLQSGGSLEITTTASIVVGQDSALSTSTNGAGDAGDITLSTQNLFIQAGGQVGSSTLGVGRGGNVEVNASESVAVAGSSPDAQISLLYAQTSGPGRAGNLKVETNHLSAQGGGQISTTTFATGRAGNILIRANRIELTGIALDVNGEPILIDGLPLSSGLFVGAEGSSGNGGGLKVETQQLSIQDGALLQANTYSSGNAGNVDVLATDSIEISGVSKESGLPARITATSGGLPEFSDRLTRTATGAGGNLSIRTNRLTVQDGGIISVNSRNQRARGAGNINIRSNQIVLDNQAQLNAQTESGDGAGIQLSGVELLTLRRNSEISTSAGLNSGGGNGGDISIDADFILNAPGENSDINADAGQGNGGNITINAQGILGITEQNQRTPQSDITASSESGVDGEISISNPTIDPTRGIVELPSTIVDASQLIAQGCRAGNREVTDALGEFVITGRGGLPPSPDDLGSSSAVITDWAELDTQPDQQGLELGSPAGERTSGVTQPDMDQSGGTQAIVEAQGWIMGQNGKVALVANAPTVTPHLPNWTVPYCTSESLQNNELHESVPDSTRYETIEPVAIEGSIVP